MSEQAQKYRDAMKSKAERLVQPTKGKVDCSSWSPSEPLDADVKTGMRPISPRAYQRGGAVAGAAASGSAARTPRKSGGMAMEMMNRNQKDANEAREGKKHVGALKRGGRSGKDGGGMVTGSFNNIRDTYGKDQEDELDKEIENKMSWAATMAGQKRGFVNYDNQGQGPTRKNAEKFEKYKQDNPGKPPYTAMRKDGGRAKRDAGGAVTDPRALAAQRMQEASSMASVPTSVMGFRKVEKGPMSIAPATLVKNGGRIERKSGGRTKAKGKTHINIMINAGQKPDGASPAPMPPPGLAPPHPIPQTVGPPPGAPPMAAPPPPPDAGPAGGLPPQLAAMLGRASGGRTNYPIDTGGGGGKARLDKIRAYGLTPPSFKQPP